MKRKAAEDDQEARPPGEAVVGVLEGAHPEGAGQGLQVEPLGLLLQHRVVEHGGVDDHPEDADGRRQHEEQQHVVGEPRGDLRGAEDADVLHDPHHGGDLRVLPLGQLVGHGRDEGRERGVGAQLGDEPAEGEHGHRLRLRDEQQRGGHHQDPADHPRPAAAEAGGGAVGEPAEEGVAGEGGDGADAEHEAEGAGALGRVGQQGVDLEGHAHDHGAEQGHEEAELREADGEDEGRGLGLGGPLATAEPPRPGR